MQMFGELPQSLIYIAFRTMGSCLFRIGYCANDEDTLLLLPLISGDETVCDGLSEAQTADSMHIS